ncbi:MAG: hypothetical protein K9I69_02595 [Ignavibacteriales bacterium]|nr:hypothetical protein [Ignavibacteriales bacterium]MCF8306260.1 hypothetical protein [Ignavibacteriales bacterium]MCF8315981.1 hypothetical protein [Ignavibacteriales bacterium]MCF8437575.1 hypothetical protein [Ignavibacteriales bacterium]
MADYGKKSEIMKINYRFSFPSGVEKEFDVFIEPKTLTVIRTDRNLPPEWTKMENFQCPHCPLDRDIYKYCPVAVNLKDVITFFSDTASYEQVKITVTTDERQYIKEAAVQTGVGSLLGVLMPTSGCPVLGKLKALVRFHLPFSSIEETEYRVFSAYLLAQFVKMKRGRKPDWEFRDLKNIYEEIRLLNQSVAKKIADLEKKDTSINSVIVLNNFADTVTFSISDSDLSYFEKVLKSFID